MEELLQLHVVISEKIPDGLDIEIDRVFDDAHDLISQRFPVPDEDVPSFEHLGTSVSSSLFERRSDNMGDVAEIEKQLREKYSNASIFRSSYKESFGEFRSTANPDSHIVLQVTNWGIQEPTVRWSLQNETLQAPPLVLDDEVFHANHDGIFAINSISGDVQWEVKADRVVQVPVGNENTIIGNTGHKLVAIERANGHVRWRTEFDLSEEEIIDSRVALGDENAYVGLRTGKIIAVSLETGDRAVVCECNDSVVGLQMIEPGLVATTNSGQVWLVNSAEKTDWPDGSTMSPSIRYSHDGTLYASTKDSLLALTEVNGAVKWRIDFPTVNDIVQSGDTLFATTANGLVALNAENGERLWDYNESGVLTTVSNPVVVDGVVAYISSSNILDGKVYTYERNLLRIIDLADGIELQKFELGVGDSYGLSVIDDAIVCSAGGELICLENFPDPA